MLSAIRSSNSMSVFSAATSRAVAQPKAVRELHDVRLVHAGDLAAAHPARVVERELEDAARAGDRDRLDREPGVGLRQLLAVRLEPLGELERVRRALLELDPGVDVFGRLADDHEVDVLVARAHARVRLARPHLRVEVELVRRRDVDRAEALADRGRDRALERDAVSPDRRERLVGERVAAVLVHHVGAGRLDVPVELDAGRLEHAARRLGQLGADSVAGDQGDAVCHRPADSTFGTSLSQAPASRYSCCASVDVDDFRPGLEGVVAFETEIAEPDKEGSALRYRGVDIEELVGRYPFEKVWGLLVDESFEPGMPQAERIELQDPSGSVDGRPAGRPRDARAEVGAEAARRHRRPSRRATTSRGSRPRRSRSSRRRRAATGPPVPESEVDQGENAAAQFLIRWRGEADPRHVTAVDTYWVSAAEHGLNASTFTARIAASTGADCAAAMSSAVGALSGPLHGGAPTRVLKMLDEVEASGRRRRVRATTCSTAASGSWVSAIASTAPRIRAPASCAGRRSELGSPRVEVAEELERAALAALREKSPDRVLETNVEFWAAVVLEIAEIPPADVPGDVRLRAGRRLVGAHRRAAAHRPADPAVGALRRRRRRTQLAERVTLAEAAARGATRSPSRVRSASSPSCARSGTRRSRRRPARSDFRERAVAYRAIAQFRFRQKIELLRRGLEDESPACRGSALLSLERLSRDHPASSTASGRCCTSSSARDDNEAVRRLAIISLRNGSPQRDTIAILDALAEDDEQDGAPRRGGQGRPVAPPQGARRARQRRRRATAARRAVRAGAELERRSSEARTHHQPAIAAPTARSSSCGRGHRGCAASRAGAPGSTTRAAAGRIRGCRARSSLRSAWPSISWTLRRSAPPSSRCVAKEWRRRCGWTRPGSRPARRGEPAQDQERARAGERAALRVQEELRPVPPVEVRAAAGEVAPERLDRLAADRDDALLAALADDAHEPVVEVDAALLEPDRLRDAQARAVEELDERAVAQRARRDARSPPSISRSASPGRERARQLARPARQRDLGRGVVVSRADQLQVAEEACARPPCGGRSSPPRDPSARSSRRVALELVDASRVASGLPRNVAQAR